MSADCVCRTPLFSAFPFIDSAPWECINRIYHHLSICFLQIWNLNQIQPRNFHCVAAKPRLWSTPSPWMRHRPWTKENGPKRNSVWQSWIWSTRRKRSCHAHMVSVIVRLRMDVYSFEPSIYEACTLPAQVFQFGPTGSHAWGLARLARVLLWLCDSSKFIWIAISLFFASCIYRDDNPDQFLQNGCDIQHCQISCPATSVSFVLMRFSSVMKMRCVFFLHGSRPCVCTFSVADSDWPISV